MRMKILIFFWELLSRRSSFTCSFRTGLWMSDWRIYSVTSGIFAYLLCFIFSIQWAEIKGFVSLIMISVKSFKMSKQPVVYLFLLLALLQTYIFIDQDICYLGLTDTLNCDLPVLWSWALILKIIQSLISEPRGTFLSKFRNLCF